MPIQIQCPNCKARMKAPDGSEGRKAKCPRCGTLIPILSTGDSPDGGEEDVKGGDDAGLFSSTKKPSKPGTPAAKSDSKKTAKSDFDLGDETSKPVRKGKKVVEEDEEEEEERPVRKGRKPVEEDDEDDSNMNFQDDDDDEEEERPRKKKKKKRRRRRDDDYDREPSAMDETFNNNFVWLVIITFCCCSPVGIIYGILGLTQCNEPANKTKAIILLVLGLLGIAMNIFSAVNDNGR